MFLVFYCIGVVIVVGEVVFCCDKVCGNVLWYEVGGNGDLWFDWLGVV